MSRDYKQSRAEPATKKSGGHGFLWGLLIGLSVAGYLWFQNQDKEEISAAQPPIAKPVAKQPPLVQPAEKVAAQPAAVEKPAEAAAEPVRESRFAFYKLLRDFEVIIPAEEIALNAPPPVPEALPVADAAELNLKNGTQYKVQIGSFRNAVDAERRRAEVGLLGLMSATQTVEISPGQVWNRVYIGPFTDPRQIEDSLDVLASNGFDFLVTKVKAKPASTEPVVAKPAATQPSTAPATEARPVTETNRVDSTGADSSAGLPAE